jgi:hypothetical protein
MTTGISTRKVLIVAGAVAATIIVSVIAHRVIKIG